MRHSASATFRLLTDGGLEILSVGLGEFWLESADLGLLRWGAVFSGGATVSLDRLFDTRLQIRVIATGAEAYCVLRSS